MKWLPLVFTTTTILVACSSSSEPTTTSSPTSPTPASPPETPAPERENDDAARVIRGPLPADTEAFHRRQGGVLYSSVNLSIPRHQLASPLAPSDAPDLRGASAAAIESPAQAGCEAFVALELNPFELAVMFEAKEDAPSTTCAEFMESVAKHGFRVRLSNVAWSDDETTDVIVEVE